VQPSRGLDRLAKQNEADELKAKSEVAEARKDADAVKLMREEVVAKVSYVNVAGPVAAVGGQTREAQLGVKLQTVQPVLNNFQVEQTGDSIRLYEPDGSVYSGNLLSTDEANKRYFRLQSPGRAPQTANAPVAGEQLFFAIGTNVSLRQQVSIEGNIVKLQTNTSSGFEQNQRGAGAAASQMIRARARVGTNQEIPIEAVPAKP
jgi:hypothetical protein